MSEDLVLHGELAEFKSQSRCEACLNRNSRCIVQAKDDQCIGCAGAACECVFVRIITKRASKIGFSWDQLLSIEYAKKSPTREEILNPK